MDYILSVHVGEKCTESIEQDFCVLDKISEFYPLGHIIKQKHLDAMANTPLDETVENRVVEELEITEGPLLVHDEDKPTDTPILIPDDLTLETLTAIFSSGDNDTNLPWNEAM